MVTPKTRIAPAYISEENIHPEKYEDSKNRKNPIIKEQPTEILNAVLKSCFNLTLLSANSAVYLTTPVFMAPLAKVSAIVIKLLKAPISATPDGPVKMATTLLATKPEAIRINVTIAEKKVVLINFKTYMLR
jgi:hypothetical protein